MTPRTTTTDGPGARAAAAFLAAARPADALEAMLVAQMAAVHEAAQRCLVRAAEVSAEHPQIEALYLRQAARLLHLFQRQSDALDRRRIAAEDRAEARARSEKLAASEWQREKEHAKRAGLPAPPKPLRRGTAWPAWPEKATPLTRPSPARGEGSRSCRPQEKALSPGGRGFG